MVAEYRRACERAVAVARRLRLDLGHCGELSQSLAESTPALRGLVAPLRGVVINAAEDYVLAVCVASMGVTRAYSAGPSVLAA